MAASSDGLWNEATIYVKEYCGIAGKNIGGNRELRRHRLDPYCISYRVLSMVKIAAHRYKHMVMRFYLALHRSKPIFQWNSS